MAKRQNQSWKQDHPNTLLTNSVEKASRAVKEAQSDPKQMTVSDAHRSLEHAENALVNAQKNNEHLEIVHQNEAQLDHSKQKLHETEKIVEDQSDTNRY